MMISPISPWPRADDPEAALKTELLRALLWREGLDRAPLAQFCATYVARLEGGRSHRLIGTYAGRLDRLIRQSGLTIAPALSRNITALALREQERGRIIAGQSAHFNDLFRAQEITALSLRGYEFACQYFAAPQERHCHATHWLIADGGQFSAACELAEQAGWHRQAASVLSPHREIFQKSGAAQLDLHRRAFAWPVSCADLNTANPHFRLTEIAASLVVERGLKQGRWLLDCAAIIRRETLDPNALAVLAGDCGIAGSLGDVLTVTQQHSPRDDTQLYERLTALRQALDRAQDCDGAQRLARLAELARGSRAALARHAIAAPKEARDAMQLRREDSARRQRVRQLVDRLRG